MKATGVREAWQEARWAPETRRTVLALYVTLALGLLLLGAEFLPPKVALTRAAFRLVQPQLVTPANPAQAQARPAPKRPLPTFLTAGFSLEVSKRLKGQKLTLDQAAIYSQRGKRLASIPTSACQRIFKTQPPAPGQTPRPKTQTPASTTQQPFAGAIYLYPLETASLRCGFFSIEKSGFQPGQTIYAVITLHSGFRRLHLKTKPAPIQS